MNHDSALVDHVKSIVESAEAAYGDGLITAPGLHFRPENLFAETHFALSALLLSVLDTGAAERWQTLAESRLRLWDSNDGPRTFFNAMAICLALLVFERASLRHSGLREILDSIVSRTREHRHVAYGQWAGNNCYLQQVAVDLVLLPLARGESPTREGVAAVATEFRRYRTEEGFFYDLPREGRRQERLCPPTYVMKMLFLLGICHEFHPTDEIAGLFSTGIEAVRPLLTRQGNFSYFGRTDNSPFSAGLTIYDLRMGERLHPELLAEYRLVVEQAEDYYRSFPRTAAGLLRCNRFRDPESDVESGYSRDSYAKVGEYSVASCAYTLLGCYCFPAPDGSTERPHATAPAAARSDDLGVVKLSGPDHEVVLRTRSELTSWDRRYIGPTVLRCSLGDELLVGAISKTVSSDSGFREEPEASRIRSISRSLREWYVHGFDQLDAITVGFVPVVRHGGVDYLPYEAVAVEQGDSSLTIRYRMVKLRARGLGACAVELRERLRSRLPGFKAQEKNRPIMGPTSAIECVRRVRVDGAGCRIEDVLTGNLRGREILLSTRAFLSAHIVVTGLDERGRLTGWGSEGRQEITIYAGRASAREFRYACVIERRQPAGAPRMARADQTP